MIINKIFMINLERKKNIAINTLQELHSLNNNTNNIFLNIEIFNATDGHKLSNDYINNNLSIKSKYTLKNPSLYDDIRSVGEIGCYLSHTKIWQEIVDNNYENCIIFEDDVIPETDYDTILKNIDSIPEDYDIAYLGWWNRYSTKYNNKNKDWLFSNDSDLKKQNVLGLYSYIISNKGAKKLLSKAFPIDVQLDTYVSLYNNVNNDFKRYLCSTQLFKADKTILGDENTHTVCDKCRFFHLHYNNIN
jgi:GR25 family glycosyltransferase involved in LPS biosynthesis